MVEFIYASGCRRGEVSALNAEDIHGGKDPFALVRLGKGKRDRMALLSQQFIRAWEAYLPVRTYLLAKWEEAKAYLQRRMKPANVEHPRDEGHEEKSEAKEEEDKKLK